VLLVEVREAAASRRRLASAKEREEAKEQKKADKKRQAQERLRDSPIGGANFMVAGVLHEGRDKVITQHARAGDTAYLVRDRNNRYSRNAIEIRLGGTVCGLAPLPKTIRSSWRPSWTREPFKQRSSPRYWMAAEDQYPSST
jgi:hypothetical protein